MGEGGERREDKGRGGRGERREREGERREGERLKWEKKEGIYMCFFPHYVTTLSSYTPTPSHPHTVLPSIA